MTKFSILLVDDNSTSLKLLRAIFEDGYQIKSANDGLEALEILLQSKIDLVITDVLMPNMDGYHLCYKIRTNAKLTDIPVMIYTATYVSLSEAKIAMEMGASYYIRKPAPSQVLLSAATNILENPEAFPHKIPTRRESTGMMQQYSAKLIAKLEQSNIDLEAAKNKIEQREKYFRALVENDYSMTVLVNEKFETTYRSPSSQTILGWTIEEMEKLKADEIVHPEDREHQQFLMRKAIENPGVMFPVITRLRHKNGTYRWLEGISINKLSDPDIAAIITNLHDVSEKKESEAKLAATEQRFRALIENSSDAIVLNDEDFVLLYQSPSVTMILGYALEERKGTRSIDYVHPEDKQKIEKVYKDAAANPNQPTPFQSRFKHRSGHYIWLEGTLTNLLGDSIVNAYVANYRDITARKKTEDDLVRLLRRFEQAQQIAHLGNWEVDLTSLKISWSAEMFRIYGIEPYSVEPSDELFLSLIHPDDIERVKSASPQGMQALKPFSFHHRIVYPSGNIRHLFTVGRYEFNPSGEPATLHGISLDVTELVEKESKLKQANQELATFIYKAYHDLRSPIVSVLGLVNVANNDTEDERSLKYFSMISSVAEKQNKMLLSLINVMEIREREPIIATVDLNELLSKVLDTLKLLEGFEKVEFKINCYGKVQTDEQMLFRIICNIVENSILYRDSNRATSEVIISSNTDDQGNLTVEIADNGHGIADEAMPRIYDLFFRGSDLSKGSGLGLYMVKNAVAKLGGSISVSSKVNSGSTFRVIIPTLD
jgi:PAS domain S-box-containing protein